LNNFLLSVSSFNVLPENSLFLIMYVQITVS